MTLTSAPVATVSSEEAMAGHLSRVAARGDAVGAWAHLDRDLAMAAAAEADRTAPRSALHGVAIGLKDIIETADQPTSYGSPAWSGHRPAADAIAVARLRKAGAVIMGKTTTTEFATYQPTATRNPHNPEHTPGGSSSGSAAAVADGQVRLALGTQTAGSVNRPGSFCGVFTFKPTYGRWPFTGVLPVALTFDTLGGFARDPRDLLPLDAVLAGASPAASRAVPALSELRVGVLRGPWFDRAEAAAAAMLQRSVDVLAAKVGSIAEVDTPEDLEHLQESHADIQSLEAGWYLQDMIARDPALVSDLLKSEIAHARALTADEQELRRDALRAAAIFADRALEEYDVLVTLAAPGEAPRGLESTGDPAFNRLASTAGLPAAGLPVGTGEHGLPLGLQLIGPRHSDQRLLGLVTTLTFEHGLSQIPDLPGGAP
ncbi:amidase [Nocardioides sp. AN3]